MADYFVNDHTKIKSRPILRMVLGDEAGNTYSFYADVLTPASTWSLDPVTTETDSGGEKTIGYKLTAIAFVMQNDLEDIDAMYYLIQTNAISKIWIEHAHIATGSGAGNFYLSKTSGILGDISVNIKVIHQSISNIMTPITVIEAIAFLPKDILSSGQLFNA